MDELSARRRDLYPTVHGTKNRKTTLPPAAFEPTTPASERLETHALGRGYIGARTDTTQQSGQTPDNEVDINRITFGWL